MPSSMNQPAVIPDPATRDFYVHLLQILDGHRVPYVVGGGYAMAYYTGIQRQTKDLDIFVRPQDCDRSLEVLAAAGYGIERTWPHFLAKAIKGDAFMDILYNSGNGLCPVDDHWINNAVRAEIMGYCTQLCPPEEMIWSKAFVQDRNRFDGADVSHLILHRGHQFDWRRLLRRFQGHERVLLAHLLLFGYAYPAHRDIIPAWAMDELIARTRDDQPAQEPICQGTFLSKDQYLFDITKGGFEDARVQPRGPLTPQDIDHFTAT